MRSWIIFCEKDGKALFYSFCGFWTRLPCDAKRMTEEEARSELAERQQYRVERLILRKLA